MSHAKTTGQKMWMTVARTAAGAVAIDLTASWCAAYYTFHNDSRKRRDPERVPSGDQYLPYRERMLELIHDLQKRPYEEVHIISDDGLRLMGRYYHQKDGAPLDIMLHGYHGTSIRDFCGGFHIAWENGHNILLVDQRAHGDSEGHTITFGVRERMDCLLWCRYAVEHFGTDCEIWLNGVSMGASTVLMASNLPLPPQVKGIIADCQYDSPRGIIRRTAGQFTIPIAFLYPLVRLGAKLFYGFDPEEASPVQSVAHTKLPILFIHGEDDRFVPIEMGKHVYDACVSEKYFFSVPGAGHCLSYLVDEEGYRSAVCAFQSKVRSSGR